MHHPNPSYGTQGCSPPFENEGAKLLFFLFLNKKWPPQSTCYVNLANKVCVCRGTGPFNPLGDYIIGTETKALGGGEGMQSFVELQ